MGSEYNNSKYDSANLENLIFLLGILKPFLLVEPLIYPLFIYLFKRFLSFSNDRNAKRDFQTASLSRDALISNKP